MNATIITELTKMKNKHTRDGDRFRGIAYSKAINAIRGIDKPIASAEDLRGIKNIGNSIIEKVATILDQGSLKIEVSEVDKLFEVFSSITGIGAVRAKSLIEKDGIKSLDELKKRKDELLNDKQRLGLKYHSSEQKRIPREEIDKFNEKFKECASNIEDLEYMIVGSYRRGQKDSGDIDILLRSSKSRPKQLSQYVDLLRENNIIIDEPLAHGSQKFMGYCVIDKIPRRIDILYCKPDEYAFAVLYFTGSAKYNVEMRSYCLAKDLTLNDHGLYHMIDKNGKKVKGEKVDHVFHTEKDITDYLGVPYLEPKDRISFSEK
jgi:DNA polymerase/3'-5' exonuclease PolX